MAAPVVIAATTKHTGTLIFLHGLGDTGQGWASAMAAVRPPHVKVICPTAPTIQVTLNAGFRMPSWFDLKSLDESGPEDEPVLHDLPLTHSTVSFIREKDQVATQINKPLYQVHTQTPLGWSQRFYGNHVNALEVMADLNVCSYHLRSIKAATKQIHSLIETEVNAGISVDRIILGGFSQGGALALYSALTYPKKIAGVAALSCWLPLNKSFPAAKKTEDTLPILQCHGDCDPVVPYKWGQMTASVLKNMLKDVEFKSYRGLSHSSSDEELNDIKQFITKNLPSQ